MCSEFDLVSVCINDNKEEDMKKKKRDEEEEEEVVSCKCDSEDDGYHTPTSPRHRLPSIVECPPAPRKPLMRLRRKRKAEIALAENEEEIMLFFSSESSNKKTKSIATIH
ncbi:hypothetical protein IHE45_09G076200 [Dioscorea alata]|uniref:Uncharacterized protein n=1 Tax=Dioscorea alata TaxID=55571 RepID=A0ACB7VG88_DIOAL|nr:hypothetical protein IHE45_09G076200 [Dioscorea alata]